MKKVKLKKKIIKILPDFVDVDFLLNGLCLIVDICPLNNKGQIDCENCMFGSHEATAEWAKRIGLITK